MELEDKDIKEIFSPLSSHEDRDDDIVADWVALQGKVSHQNFFLFGLYHVNIYNTTAAIVVTIILSWFFISSGNQHQTKRPEVQKRNVVTKIDQQSQITHETKGHVPTVHTGNVPGNGHITGKQTQSVIYRTTSPDVRLEISNKRKTIPKKGEAPVSEKTIEKHTESESKPETVTHEESVVVKLSKTICKVSSDTVVKYDTVKQKSQKRKGLFSR